jgi:hypothetical protein
MLAGLSESYETSLPPTDDKAELQNDRERGRGASPTIFADYVKFVEAVEAVEDQLRVLV